MEADPRITLYERRECHLCEEARQVLDALIGPDRYDRFDIDADDARIEVHNRTAARLAVVGRARRSANSEGRP